MRKAIINFDAILLVVLTVVLSFYYIRIIPREFGDLLLLLTAVIGTLPVIYSTFRSLQQRKVSVDLLASIALVASLLAKQWAGAVFINMMLASARILGDYAEQRARHAIDSLLKLRPQKVMVKRDGKIVEEDVDNLKVGDWVVIESGERIPVDGVVESGAGSVDQSSLTGESVPVAKVKENKVFSSTLVVSGSLVVKAEKVGKDTTLEKIINLVKESQKGKTQITTMAERFATWYIILTLAGVLAGYIIFRNPILLLSILLVACADDIAVAVPLAFLASVGHAAKRGIIVKGGGFLEGLTKVKVVVADKTGTLTLGKLKVEEAKTFKNYTEQDLIKLAATAEFFSNHPAAKAIVEYANKNKISFEKAETFTELPGQGATAVYREKTVAVGKLAFLQGAGVKILPAEEAEILKIKEKGFNINAVAYGNELIGFLALADEVRPGVKPAVQKLKSMGLKRWVMLTGDNEKVAQKISQEVGLEEFHANLLPEDKINFIKKVLNKKYKVAMIGDGVNDAAALALADIGIAMGVIGSDAAIEAADVALMEDNFGRIPEVVELGYLTTRVAKQDFWIWGIVNVVGFFLVFAKVIGPEGAAAYNFVTDFFPLFNSLKLFRLFKMRF